MHPTHRVIYLCHSNMFLLLWMQQLLWTSKNQLQIFCWINNEILTTLTTLVWFLPGQIPQQYAKEPCHNGYIDMSYPNMNLHMRNIYCNWATIYKHNQDVIQRLPIHPDHFTLPLMHLCIIEVLIDRSIFPWAVFIDSIHTLGIWSFNINILRKAAQLVFLF